LERVNTNRRGIVLAALAEFSARFMEQALPPQKKGRRRAGT
jgi:hypothetical protein